MLSLIIPQKLISLYSYLFIHTSVIFNNGNSGRHRLHLNTALFFCRVPQPTAEQGQGLFETAEGRQGTQGAECNEGQK